MPENIQNLMSQNYARAASPPILKEGKFTGRSSIYFNRNFAFSSAKELYYTMTHEFMHVSQHALLKGVNTSINTFAFRELQELSAYSYETSLGSSNYGGFTAQDVRSLATQFPDYYRKFRFYNFSWTRTVNFREIGF